MEINDTTKSVYQACHWYGIAPYKIIRNKRNEIVDFKLKWQFCVVSIILVIFYIFSIEYALTNDTNAGYLLR